MANGEGERTERRERAWGREREARLGFYREREGRVRDAWGGGRPWLKAAIDGVHQWGEVMGEESGRNELH